MRVWLTAALAAAAAPAVAAPDAADLARQAVGQIEAAGQALDAARGAGDRIAALTGVIRAYETGLAALRDGIRQAALRETVLLRGLEAESARLSGLLAALERFEPGSERLFLAHPDGPEAAVRAGLLLSAMTPELNARVADLRGRLEEVRVIRTLQATALERLEAGLTGAQEARAALALAISERGDLPARYAEDAEAIKRLRDSADTLSAFAEGLAVSGNVDEAHPSGLPLPVDGQVLRGFGEADAAGISRPGWVIATLPRALVTTPVAATVRYAGPLLDYGNVMILEPDAATLMVLAGLSEVYGATGEVLAAGAPVGLMGGKALAGAEFIAESAENGGARRTETLYLEVREGSDPVDPAVWFAGTKDENR